jgi:hypothetical protein
VARLQQDLGERIHKFIFEQAGYRETPSDWIGLVPIQRNRNLSGHMNTYYLMGEDGSIILRILFWGRAEGCRDIPFGSLPSRRTPELYHAFLRITTHGRVKSGHIRCPPRTSCGIPLNEVDISFWDSLAEQHKCPRDCRQFVTTCLAMSSVRARSVHSN